MGFIQILKLVISLLPMIIDAIKAIEAAIPHQGTGQDKLALLKTMLQATYDSSNEAAGQFDKIWPVIQSSVCGIVGIFNKVKVFNSGIKVDPGSVVVKAIPEMVAVDNTDQSNT